MGYRHLHDEATEPRTFLDNPLLDFPSTPHFEPVAEVALILRECGGDVARARGREKCIAINREARTVERDSIPFSGNRFLAQRSAKDEDGLAE